MTALFIVIFFFVYQAYLFAIPHARINFKLYKPANTGVAHATETLETPEFKLFGHNFDSLVHPKVTVDYYLSGKQNVHVFESNKPLATNCTNEFSDECDATVTSNQQEYLVATMYYSKTDKKADQWVDLQRGDTYIRIIRSGITIPETMHYDHIAWDNLIDSLEPAPFKNLPVVRSHPGP